MAAQGDDQLLQTLNLEYGVLEDLIHRRAIRDQQQSQALQHERYVRVMTMNELVTERQFHLQTAEANAELQQMLDIGQQQYHSAIAELNNLRNQHFTEKETEEISMEEVIKNIENDMAKKYQSRLQERDDKIAELQLQLKPRASASKRKKSVQKPRNKPIPLAMKVE